MPEEIVACLDCDSLITLPSVTPGQQIICLRCQHTVVSRPIGGNQHSLAYGLTALIALILANLYPFLSLEARGINQEMTLWQTAEILHQYHFSLLAAMVLCFILIIPSLMLIFLLLLVTPIVTAKSPPFYAKTLGRWMFQLGPWNMVEVFVIGILASLTKIATLASVIFGISFWAYIAFGLFLTAALANFDRYEFWHIVEQEQRANL